MWTLLEKSWDCCLPLQAAFWRTKGAAIALSAVAGTSAVAATPPESSAHAARPAVVESVPTGDEPGADSPRPDVRLELVALEQDGKSVQQFVVSGLKPDELAAVRNQLASSVGSTGPRPLTAHLIDATGDVLPAMLARVQVQGASVVVQPRFPVAAGARVELRLRAGDQVRALGRLEREATQVAAPRSRVEQVYPTADRLPANQLRFYVHFSQAMRRGEAYRNLQLLDDKGRDVPFPFLELGEELWSPDGRRFTLLLDPGRVKRLLEPRRELGPVLMAGRKYTLVIKPSWNDQFGRGLAEGFRKTFHVTERDDAVPDLKNWKVNQPVAGTREPLLVEFDEPLDHAMLSRVVTVWAEGEQPDSNRRVEGEIHIGRHERSWRLTPNRPWAAGLHRLRVASELEDRAGNNLLTPFEVDLTQVQQQTARPDALWLQFTPASK